MKTTSPKTTPQFNREVCLACFTCVDLCPVGALELQILNSAHGFRRYPALGPGKNCIGCNSCETECPASAISMKSQ